MRRGWGRVFRIRNVERDVAEELAYHRERTVEELVEGGATREEAEAEATRRFGDEGRWRRELERLDRSVESRRRLAGVVSALWDVWRVVGLGLAVGLAGAWALAPRVEALLYETSPRDAVTFGAVIATLLLVSLVAAGLPAVRASRVDPNEALRAE